MASSDLPALDEIRDSLKQARKYSGDDDPDWLQGAELRENVSPSFLEDGDPARALVKDGDGGDSKAATAETHATQPCESLHRLQHWDNEAASETASEAASGTETARSAAASSRTGGGVTRAKKMTLEERIQSALKVGRKVQARRTPTTSPKAEASSAASPLEATEDAPPAFGSVRDNINVYSAGTKAGPSGTEAATAAAAAGAATLFSIFPASTDGTTVDAASNRPPGLAGDERRGTAAAAAATTNAKAEATATVTNMGESPIPVARGGAAAYVSPPPGLEGGGLVNVKPLSGKQVATSKTATSTKMKTKKKKTRGVSFSNRLEEDTGTTESARCADNTPVGNGDNSNGDNNSSPTSNSNSNSNGTGGFTMRDMLRDQGFNGVKTPSKIPVSRGAPNGGRGVSSPPDNTSAGKGKRRAGDSSGPRTPGSPGSRGGSTPHNGDGDGGGGGGGAAVVTHGANGRSNGYNGAGSSGASSAVTASKGASTKGGERHITLHKKKKKKGAEHPNPNIKGHAHSILRSPAAGSAAAATGAAAAGELTATRGALEKANRDKSEAEDSLRIAQSQFTNTRSALQDARKQKAAAEKQLLTVQKQLRACKSQMEAKDEEQAGLRRSVQARERDVERTSMLRQGDLHTLEEERQRISDLTDQVSGCQQREAAAAAARDAAVEAGHESAGAVQVLTKKLGAAEKKQAALSQALEAQQQRFMTNSKGRVDATKCAEEAMASVDAFAAKVTVLREEKAGVVAEAEALVGKLQACELRAEAAEVAEAELSANLQEVLADGAQLQQEKESAVAALQAARSTIASMREGQGTSGKELRNARAEIERLEVERAAQSKALRASEATTARLEAQAAGGGVGDDRRDRTDTDTVLEAAIGGMERLLQSKTDECERALAQLKQSQGSINAKNEQLQDHIGESQRLAGECDRLREQGASRGSELSRLRQSSTQLQRRAETAESEEESASLRAEQAENREEELRSVTESESLRAEQAEVREGELRSVLAALQTDMRVGKAALVEELEAKLGAKEAKEATWAEELASARRDAARDVEAARREGRIEGLREGEAGALATLNMSASASILSPANGSMNGMNSMNGGMNDSIGSIGGGGEGGGYNTPPPGALPWDDEVNSVRQSRSQHSRILATTPGSAIAPPSSIGRPSPVGGRGAAAAGGGGGGGIGGSGSRGGVGQAVDPGELAAVRRRFRSPDMVKISLKNKLGRPKHPKRGRKGEAAPRGGGDNAAGDVASDAGAVDDEAVDAEVAAAAAAVSAKESSLLARKHTLLVKSVKASEKKWQRERSTLVAAREGAVAGEAETKGLLAIVVRERNELGEKASAVESLLEERMLLEGEVAELRVAVSRSRREVGEERSLWGEEKDLLRREVTAAKAVAMDARSALVQALSALGRDGGGAVAALSNSEGGGRTWEEPGRRGDGRDGRDGGGGGARGDRGWGGGGSSGGRTGGVRSAGVARYGGPRSNRGERHFDPGTSFG